MFKVEIIGKMLGNVYKTKYIFNDYTMAQHFISEALNHYNPEKGFENVTITCIKQEDK